jgi:hypothetical protein
MSLHFVKRHKIYNVLWRPLKSTNGKELLFISINKFLFPIYKQYETFISQYANKYFIFGS